MRNSQDPEMEEEAKDLTDLVVGAVGGTKGLQVDQRNQLEIDAENMMASNANPEKRNPQSMLINTKSQEPEQPSVNINESVRDEKGADPQKPKVSLDGKMGAIKRPETNSKHQGSVRILFEASVPTK